MTSERGSVTPAVLVLGLLVVAAAVVVTGRGVAVVGRHRIQAAADLAALAGAARALEGGERACTAATAIASRNGAAMTDCAVSGDIVDVEVAGVVRIGRLGTWTVVRRARAGPAREDPAA